MVFYIFSIGDLDLEPSNTTYKRTLDPHASYLYYKFCWNRSITKLIERNLFLYIGHSDLDSDLSNRMCNPILHQNASYLHTEFRWNWSLLTKAIEWKYFFSTVNKSATRVTQHIYYNTISNVHKYIHTSSWKWNIALQSRSPIKYVHGIFILDRALNVFLPASVLDVIIIHFAQCQFCNIETSEKVRHQHNLQFSNLPFFKVLFILILFLI